MSGPSNALPQFNVLGQPLYRPLQAAPTNPNPFRTLEQVRAIQTGARQKKFLLIGGGVFATAVAVGLIGYEIRRRTKKPAVVPVVPVIPVVPVVPVVSQVTVTNDNGTCPGTNYCYSNWGNEVKSQAPNWVGARCVSVKDASTGAAMTCSDMTGKKMTIVCTEDKSRPFPTVMQPNGCQGQVPPA